LIEAVRNNKDIQKKDDEIEEIRDLVDRYNIKLKMAIDHFESNHLKRSKQKNNNPNKSYP